jgi:hypothetical protein
MRNPGHADLRPQNHNVDVDMTGLRES